MKSNPPNSRSNEQGLEKLLGRVDGSVRWQAALLAMAALLIRLPFLDNFDLVSFDGTYYVNQAKSILAGSPGHGGTFPLGYPVAIASVLLVLQDGVRAAQTVSVAAGVGCVLLTFFLAKAWMSARNAFLCALALALTPLFVRLSTMTMSETLYMFWVLLALYLYSKERWVASGLAMGAAGATRPEAFGILLVLCALNAKRPKRAAVLAGSFLILFALNSTVLSVAAGRTTIIPKFHLLGAVAVDLRDTEATVDGNEDDAYGLREPTAVLPGYVARIPADTLVLIRHILPLAFALAVFGAYKRRGFLLAAFVPFFINPLFTPRIEPRFVLPFVPFAMIYAFAAVDRFVPRRVLRHVYALLVILVMANFAVNRDQLTVPVSEGFEGAKDAGLDLRERAFSEERVADRKPFVAFYAGCTYLELPTDPYDVTIDYLAREGIEYLSLTRGMIDYFRPHLTPLLYDFTVINGELRYDQIYTNKTGVMVYQRDRNAPPAPSPRVRPLHTPRPGSGPPTWSPDGRRVAYTADDGQRGGVYAVALDGGDTLLAGANGPLQEPAWSHDGHRIAFVSNERGNPDIVVVDLRDGTATTVVSDLADDIDPVWWPNDDRLCFSSNRTGVFEIWMVDFDGAPPQQVSGNGPNRLPSVSPDGRRMAWIRPHQWMVIIDLDTRQRTIPNAPRDVRSRPTWCPDGLFVAVEAADWGSRDVYLLTSDGQQALLLSKSPGRTGAPDWNPRRNQLVVETDEGLAIVDGLAPYLSRLATLKEIVTYERPPTPDGELDR